MSKSRFGECLKQARESRGVSRGEICAAIRVGPRFLEALENEQWENLPGGIFNRGLVRAVARFLELEEDALLAEYDLARNEEHSQIPASVNPPPRGGSRNTRVGRLALVGMLPVIVFLGMSWRGWTWRHKAFPQAGSGGNGVVSAARLAGQREGDVTGPSAVNASSTASGALSAPAQTTEPRELELKVEAGKETVVSVSADGTKVFEGSMIAGQSRTFVAQDALDVSAEDAGALLLELNGQTLAPLGPPGRPGVVTVTRGDLKASGGGAD